MITYYKEMILGGYYFHKKDIFILNAKKKLLLNGLKLSKFN